MKLIDMIEEYSKTGSKDIEEILVSYMTSSKTSFSGDVLVEIYNCFSKNRSPKKIEGVSSKEYILSYARLYYTLLNCRDCIVDSINIYNIDDDKTFIYYCSVFDKYFKIKFKTSSITVLSMLGKIVPHRLHLKYCMSNKLSFTMCVGSDNYAFDELFYLLDLGLIVSKKGIVQGTVETIDKSYAKRCLLMS